MTSVLPWYDQPTLIDHAPESLCAGSTRDVMTMLLRDKLLWTTWTHGPTTISYLWKGVIRTSGSYKAQHARHIHQVATLVGKPPSLIVLAMGAYDSQWQVRLVARPSQLTFPSILLHHRCARGAAALVQSATLGLDCGRCVHPVGALAPLDHAERRRGGHSALGSLRGYRQPLVCRRCLALAAASCQWAVELFGGSALLRLHGARHAAWLLPQPGQRKRTGPICTAGGHQPLGALRRYKPLADERPAASDKPLPLRPPPRPYGRDTCAGGAKRTPGGHTEYRARRVG